MFFPANIFGLSLSCTDHHPSNSSDVLSDARPQRRETEERIHVMHTHTTRLEMTRNEDGALAGRGFRGSERGKRNEGKKGRKTIGRRERKIIRLPTARDR